MWSNFGNRFNGDCFKDLRRDFNRLREMLVKDVLLIIAISEMP